MDGYIIRKYRKEDFNQVLDILYKTGYMGEDLSDIWLLNNKFFFGRLFIEYYLIYEKEFCLVAENLNSEVIGYIVGSGNTRYLKRNYLIKMTPKILCSFFPALVKDPGIIKILLSYAKNRSGKYITDDFLLEYPAHFHINIREDGRNMGLGGALLKTFEDLVLKKECCGIHLKTSNKNISAINFYYKKGYNIVHEFDDVLWPNVKDYKTLIFAKKI